jgi:ATP-binding cassette subfamily C protein
LDEATSALDPSNEEKIIEVLGGLKESVTMLAVSHQSALKAIADRIYNIDSGEVREINQE